MLFIELILCLLDDKYRNCAVIAEEPTGTFLQLSHTVVTCG